MPLSIYNVPGMRAAEVNMNYLPKTPPPNTITLGWVGGEFQPKNWGGGYVVNLLGFPGASDGKESSCDTGDPGSIFGLGRSPGEGNGNPLQYSCLEKSMD